LVMIGPRSDREEKTGFRASPFAWHIPRPS
jgi:hypothetical protein